MNAGVSSRGSPIPKLMTSTPDAASARVASVSRTNGYVRRPVEHGGQLHLANASSTS